MKKPNILIVITLVLSITISVVSAINTRTFEAIEADFPIILNGFRQPFGSSWAPVVTINGRTYVPLRRVAGLFGHEVEWNEEERTIYVNRTHSRHDTLEPAFVSMARLIAHEDYYHGRRVVISGILDVERQSISIFFTRDCRRYLIFKNALFVNGLDFRDYEHLNGQYVRLMGEFDNLMTGQGLYSGAIINVESIESLGEWWQRQGVDIDFR